MSGPIEFAPPASVPVPVPTAKHDAVTVEGQQPTPVSTPAQTVDDSLPMSSSLAEVHSASSLPTPPPFHDTPAPGLEGDSNPDLALAPAPVAAVAPAPPAPHGVTLGGQAPAVDSQAPIAPVPVVAASPPPPALVANGINGHASVQPTLVPAPLASPVAPAVEVAATLPPALEPAPSAAMPLAGPSEIPPPPVLPLPSHIEIPHPHAHLARADSQSSTLVQPPTPGPLPSPVPAPAQVNAQPAPAPAFAPAPTAPAPAPAPAPVAVAEDVKMEDGVFAEQYGTKRAAPAEEGPVAMGDDDARDQKRARVESEAPPLSQQPSYASASASASPAPSPQVVAPAPVAAPAPAPPVSGYDPAAFNTLPSPALAPPPPTISPSDLHNLASPAHSPAPPTPVATQPVYQPAPAQAAAPAPTPVYQPQPAYAPAPQPTYEAAPPQQPVYAAQPAYEAPQGEGPVAIMTKAQQKFAVNLVRTLKKNRSAPPFLRPVDPVALLIPDYLRVVTEPMDIGTIEQKLNSTGKAMTQAQKYGRVFGLDYSGIGEWEGKSPNVYRTADEFREDVDRVWENCFKYNGPKDKNPVSAMAGALQEVSEKLFRTMPFAPAVEYIPEPPRQPSPEISRKPPPNSFVPTIRRSEDGNRPKREIHAPARELPYEQTDGGKSRTGRVSGKTAQEQLRYCKEVIKELFKKIHEPYCYPFYEPVNYVALNIPQYPSIVRHPMDLGTVRAKLEQNLYPSPAYGPFENDVRQVFKNCYLFNPEGSAVNEWGHKVEGIFDAKWAERPMGDDDDDDSEDEGTMQLEMQLQSLQAQIEERKAQKKYAKEQKRAAERAAKPPKPSTSKKVASAPEVARNRATMQSSASSHRKRPSGGNGSGKKNGKKARKTHDSSDEDDEEMMMQHQAASGEVSFEMKRELAVKIVSFEGENLERAIDIIRQGRPDLLSDVNKEIELDIDQLDQRTLLALYRFVCPSSTARKPKAASANRRSATGGTKRKNLDEIKESERIEMLEQRLRDFESGGQQPDNSRRNSAAAADADQASSDSSSDGDSDSSDDDDED